MLAVIVNPVTSNPKTYGLDPNSTSTYCFVATASLSDSVSKGFSVTALALIGVFTPFISCAVPTTSIGPFALEYQH